MKLSMLGIVIRTVAVRRILLAAIAQAEQGQIGVTIGGEAQDDAMSHRVKASVLSELKGRLASIDRDLRSYGVEVDGDERIFVGVNDRIDS